MITPSSQACRRHHWAGNTQVLPVRYPIIIGTNTPVSRFRLHTLQEQKDGLVFPLAEISFSTSPPSWACDLFKLARHYPPSKAHSATQEDKPRQLTDDVRLAFRSIHNPTNHEELLPLWVLTVWDNVSSPIGSLNRWSRYYSWVKRLRATRREGESTRLALTHFEVLG